MTTLILRPFLLQRLKTDVEKSLSKKKKIILYTPMTSKQKEYNDQLVARTLNEYFAEKSQNPGAALKSRLNNVCMQLRKYCNHPDLFVSHFEDDIHFPPVDELVAQCAKFKLMERLLVQLRDRGHKILDLIEYYLEERGHNPCRIDGNVKQEVRQEQIKSFNEDKERFVFILSICVGGLGINLTSADTVIIYGSDWAATRGSPVLWEEAEPIMREMSALIFQAKELHYDNATMLMKLKAEMQAVEEMANTAATQSATFGQLAAEAVPKSLHCLSLRLVTKWATDEKLREEVEAKQRSFAPKLTDTSLHHFCVFSDNVLGASVVINSTRGAVIFCGP